MTKFAIFLFISLIVCAYADQSNFESIREKLIRIARGDDKGYPNYMPYGQPAYVPRRHHRGYGGVTLNANAENGPYRSSARAASEYVPRAYHNAKFPKKAPHHYQHQTNYQASGAGLSASVGGYGQPAHQQQFYQLPKSIPPFQPPVFPSPRYGAPASRKVGNGGVASAAATAGAGGAAGAASATTGATTASAATTSNHEDPHDRTFSEAEVYNEHFEEPENENTYVAAHGTYENNGDGHESSSYVRSTSDVNNHEDGHKDDNHYYNAQSYGNTYDENKHEAFHNNDEDIVHTPNVFRSKKRSTNYVKDSNKARREVGTGVTAHDKHSSSYNKNFRKFKEQVDKRKDKHGAGVVDTASFSSSRDFDDEDDEIYDSDGLGTFVGVDGVNHPARQSGVGVATATSAAGSGGVSAAASVGKGAASSSASSGH